MIGLFEAREKKIPTFSSHPTEVKGQATSAFGQMTLCPALWELPTSPTDSPHVVQVSLLLLPPPPPPPFNEVPFEDGFLTLLLYWHCAACLSASDRRMRAGHFGAEEEEEDLFLLVGQRTMSWRISRLAMASGKMSPVKRRHFRNRKTKRRKRSNHSCGKH